MSCNGNCSSCSSKDLEERFNTIKNSHLGENLTNFSYDFEKYSRPYAMLLGLTNDCNLACKYCFVKQKPDYMTYEIAEQAIEWMKENYQARNKTDKLDIVFFGGEPLLQYDEVIVPIVNKYKDIASFSITTNGVLLDEDKVDFFYKNNISVLLSFDGVKKVQNNQRVGKNIDSFQTVLNNIPYLLLRLPNTTMRATLTKESLPYLYDSVLMAEELGFRTIAFVPNAYETWGVEEEIIYEQQLTKIGLHIYKSFFNNTRAIQVKPLIDSFKKISSSLKHGLYFNNHLFRCGLGTTSCAITPDGSIIPCQEKISNPTTILGDVWNGIQPELHEKFLNNYIQELNNFTCSLHLSTTKECLHCISTICPSRLEDLNYKFSTPTCIFNRITLRVANRLHMLCYQRLNPIMSLYFNEEEENINGCS
jgi:uncharacterized protein